MKIYFGAESVTEVMDSSGMLGCPGEPNKLYYYGVEFGSNVGGIDEVCIFDGCDRSIPIDIESVEPMIKALERILVNHHALAVAKEIRENVENPHYAQAI